MKMGDCPNTMEYQTVGKADRSYREISTRAHFFFLIRVYI